MSNKWLWILGAIGVFFLLRGREGNPGVSGRGVGGAPRLGNPKTEAERRASHASRYGTEELPPRGRGQGLA